ncbi:BnaA03g59190D [Brassica napus]|uniref:BnaA03g59190D protein n=1 Tax=Brassica napus TaxID=3708 RepID=A0A078J814_BRANA|nr:BnaA03g59190D [Brassica napus]
MQLTRYACIKGTAYLLLIVTELYVTAFAFVHLYSQLTSFSFPRRRRQDGSRWDQKMHQRSLIRQLDNSGCYKEFHLLPKLHRALVFCLTRSLGKRARMILIFDISKDGPQPIIYESSEDWFTNLNILLKWSQFEDIGAHGTKVIIYNLWLNDEGIYELSFDDDDEDKRLRDESVQDEKRINSRTLDLRSHISYRVRHSLRAYTSMLYLKMFGNFKIIYSSGNLCGAVRGIYKERDWHGTDGKELRKGTGRS